MSETLSKPMAKSVVKHDTDLCVFPDVYVRLVGTKEKPELWVYDKQGIVPAKCQYDLESLAKKNDIKTFFVADVEQSKNGKFYRILNSPVPTLDPPESMLAEVADLNEKIKEDFLANIELKKVEKEKRMKEENNIPPIPSNLYINKVTWSILSISINKGKYPILLGPKGCGKTEAAESIAKALNMDFRPFSLGAAFKPKQFFAGMLHATEAGTEFLKSDFLTAFEAKVPTLIFLDEATRVPQAASNYLMTILDRKQNYVYVEELGKRIYKGENVHFVSAGNIGMQYTDTRTLDGAFMDRLVKLWVDYLPPKEELELVLKKVPNAPSSSVTRLIAWANICREKEKSGDLSTGVSTRQVIDMADFLAAGISLDEIYSEVFMYLFVNGQQDEREHVKTFIAGSGS
jgi:nitric oxide reductase NorQ protein